MNEKSFLSMTGCLPSGKFTCQSFFLIMTI